MKNYFKVYLFILLDILLINLGVYFTFALKFQGQLAQIGFSELFKYGILITPIALASLLGFKLYKCMWEYASIGELKSIFKAVISTSIIFEVVNVFIPLNISLSIIIINAMLLLILLGGSRFIVRVLKKDRKKNSCLAEQFSNILIVGAGGAGALVARALKDNRSSLRPIGFADDNIGKLKMHLYGLPVLGTRNDIPNIVSKFNIHEVILALPSAPGQEIRELVKICKQTSAKLKILPSVFDLINNNLPLKQIREIRVEDLLHRDPVNINLQEVAGYLKRKTVMVTGAGGSIGSELCRQIALFQPENMILLGRGENSIYEIFTELKERFPKQKLTPIIADVKNLHRINPIFDQYRPTVVFHAAAHKHVPLMENSPDEAFTNNVLGTYRLANAADSYGTELFVLVSTDKAVNPTSVMGATKRTAEMVIQAKNNISKTRFVGVRFGNVLGSRGSVVRLFQKQIEKGGPLTITHPDMVRYFMTIPEAVQLVIQAGMLAKGGEIFVLDMGEPVKILDLANDMIRLSADLPKDIKITYTGIRPGEKIFEELMSQDEAATVTIHNRIFQVKAQNQNIDILSTINEISNRTNPLSAEEAILLLKNFIANYERQNMD